jgi:glutathione S-transferase
MNDVKLYCFAQSGNAYKAALMLSQIGARWEPVFVDFFNGETRSAPYRSTVNEMGEVPVLIDGDVKLSQTGAILTYLAGKSGKFGGGDERAKLEVLRWILFDNHKFTSYLATYRFFHAFTKDPDKGTMEFLRGRMTGALGIVDKHLTGQPFVIGSAPTIADFSMCGYLYFPPEEFGIDIAADYPSIGAWLGRIKALPGWKHPYDMMPGHPLPPR